MLKIMGFFILCVSLWSNGFMIGKGKEIILVDGLYLYLLYFGLSIFLYLTGSYLLFSREKK